RACNRLPCTLLRQEGSAVAVRRIGEKRAKRVVGERPKPVVGNVLAERIEIEQRSEANAMRAILAEIRNFVSCFEQCRTASLRESWIAAEADHAECLGSIHERRADPDAPSRERQISFRVIVVA